MIQYIHDNSEDERTLKSNNFGTSLRKARRKPDNPANDE